jgi:hypothetical protein
MPHSDDQIAAALVDHWQRAIAKVEGSADVWEDEYSHRSGCYEAYLKASPNLKVSCLVVGSVPWMDGHSTYVGLHASDTGGTVMGTTVCCIAGGGGEARGWLQSRLEVWLGTGSRSSRQLVCRAIDRFTTWTTY